MDKAAGSFTDLGGGTPAPDDRHVHGIICDLCDTKKKKPTQSSLVKENIWAHSLLNARADPPGMVGIGSKDFLYTSHHFIASLNIKLVYS